jgi:TRAP-type mannitol/chloroaromatic compound transport system permease small subunit
MMRPFFFRLAKMLDHVNGVIGASAKWLSLIMVLVQFLVVVLRYVFGIGSIQLQESILYMHAILFLTGAAYTWSQDGHVRVDILYAQQTEKRKAAINFIGAIIFVVPVSLLIIWVSFDYVSFSWAVREGSRETSGIQGIYILKSFILVFASQICLQAFSVILRGGYDLPATPNHKNDRSSLQESQTS